MSQTSEEIEGKLAAYVDGTLDDAGRAEIERHVAANPHHARLLKDLAAGKAMLGDLPREAAPPEILETIQTQLERRLLLDEPADEAVIATIRPHRWRSVPALAAVLVLGATLAVVIYSVLPGSGDAGNDLVVALERAERREAERAASAGEAGRPDPGEPLASAVAPPGPDAPAGGAARTDDGGTLSAGGGIAAGASRDVPSAVAPATPADALVPEPDPVWLVSAGDPTVITANLRAFLADNRIPFDAVLEPSPAFAMERVAGDLAPRGRDLAPDGEFGRTAAREATPATSPSTDPDVDPAPGAFPSGTMLANSGARAGRELNAVGGAGDESVFVLRKVSRAQMQAINDLLQQQAAEPSTPGAQPTDPQQAQQHSATAAPETGDLVDRTMPTARAGPVERQLAQQQARQQVAVAVEQNAAPAVQQFYNQVAQQSRAGGGGLGVDQAEEDSPHRLPESAGIIAAGEKLVIRLAFLPREELKDDVRSKAMPAPVPGEPLSKLPADKEWRVTVGEDGEIEPPDGLPKIAALGLTPAELEQRVADVAAGLPPTPDAVMKVSVAREPAASAATPDASSWARPASPPATAPAAEPTAVDEVTDLVIVVRGAPTGDASPAGSPPAAETAPADPPASAVPATQPSSPLFRPGVGSADPPPSPAGSGVAPTEAPSTGAPPPSPPSSSPPATSPGV